MKVEGFQNLVIYKHLLYFYTDDKEGNLPCSHNNICYIIKSETWNVRKVKTMHYSSAHLEI